MKTIIAGSRNIDSYKVIEDAVKESGFQITQVVSGGARGVDKLGETYASANNIPLTVANADWEAYGGKAGIIRNKEMAAYADALIAIWDGTSPGTKNMIDEAKKRNLKVFVKTVDVAQILKENGKIPFNMD